MREDLRCDRCDEIVGGEQDLIEISDILIEYELVPRYSDYSICESCSETLREYLRDFLVSGT